MYGELDNNLTPFLKSLKGNTLPRFGPMKAYVHFAYVGNVAMIFVKALESLQNNPELGGEYFFGADDTPANPMTGFLKPFLDCLNAQVSTIVTHNNYFFVKMTHNGPILKTHVIH
jgi:hypothetical protein